MCTTQRGMFEPETTSPALMVRGLDLIVAPELQISPSFTIKRTSLAPFDVDTSYKTSHRLPIHGRGPVQRVAVTQDKQVHARTAAFEEW